MQRSFAFHPSDEDLSLGTPVLLRMTPFFLRVFSFYGFLVAGDDFVVDGLANQPICAQS